MAAAVRPLDARRTTSAVCGVIQLTDVSKQFRRGARAIDALRGVTLAIAPGEACAIVGPNGAGKTTLFGIVMGFLRPGAGRVTIEGRDARTWVRAHGAGWLPERFAPPSDWRVGEAVTALARLDGGDNAKRRAADALDRFGLTAYAHRRIATLSRGLLQRLGLAQALCTPHRLVLLDEPTDGLDLDGRIALRAVLSDLRAAGTTVLLASHDLAEVERTADRVALIADGLLRDTDFAARAPRMSWVLHLVARESLVLEVFPGAERLDAEPRAANDEGDTRHAVTVTDATALNAGLARIIAAGGLVLGVARSGEPLETRVAQALRQPRTDSPPGDGSGDSARGGQ